MTKSAMTRHVGSQWGGGAEGFPLCLSLNRWGLTLTREGMGVKEAATCQTLKLYLDRHPNIYNYPGCDVSVSVITATCVTQKAADVCLCDVRCVLSLSQQWKPVCSTWHHQPLGACFILFSPQESCQQVAHASVHPFALSLSPKSSSEGLSADESRCLGTPLTELGIPERKVAALLMKG